jgi:hypothetical protein
VNRRSGIKRILAWTIPTFGGGRIALETLFRSLGRKLVDTR